MLGGVIFLDFAHRAQLPEGELVPGQVTPKQAGEYGFHCGMGMLYGKVVGR